jgi:hypothetical protein
MQDFSTLKTDQIQKYFIFCFFFKYFKTIQKKALPKIEINFFPLKSTQLT